MSAPSDSMLYYPSIEFHDDAWVKAALLVWERVYRIVPKDYVPEDSEAIQQAVDAGLVCNLQLENADTDEAYSEFQRFIETRHFLPHGLTSRHEVHVLHPNKIDGRLYPQLERLARHVFWDGRLEVSPGLARGYMYYLSLVMARRRNLCRGTDDRDSWSVSPYFSENGNFSESLYRLDGEMYYCSLIIQDVIPTRIRTTPMSLVLEFAEKRRAEKEELRKAIHSVAEGMSRCDSAEHREHIRHTFAKDCERKRDQLRRSMTFFRPSDLVCSYLAVGLPATITTLALGGSDPYSLTSLSQSILVGAVAAYADYRRVSRSNRPPALASYLMDLDEAAANEKRIPYFQRSLEQFIND